MELDAILTAAIEAGASDVHFKVGSPPVLRVDGALVPLGGVQPLGDRELAEILDRLTASAPLKRRQLEETGDLDIAYVAADLPRFRVAGFRQRGATSFAFRVVPNVIPGFEELQLPSGVRRLADEERGLVLVTGATGSGKSTTLAAMIDHINRTRRVHVVTIEDPIEVLHPDRLSIVNQREIGLDTVGFQHALRHVLRQDPDVILIGELRDEETALVALQAAESGHLVLSTLHTLDAAETIARMVEFFPPAKHEQVATGLAGVLRGVIAQRLLPRLGGGRVPAVEVMVVNARIAELIRERKLHEIPKAIAEGDFYDMQTFSDSLIDLVLRGLVDEETAARAASQRHDFEIELDRALKTGARQRPGMGGDAATVSRAHAAERTEPRSEPETASQGLRVVES